MRRIFPLVFLFFGCQKSQTQPDLPEEVQYENPPVAFSISGAKIAEASGLTYSLTMPGYLWVNQDSGNPPLLYLLKDDGTVTDSLMLEGATNRDWEEVVLGRGPQDDKRYLYVGDIGDNEAKYPGYTIYRFEEPASGVRTINNYEQIRYTYEDGARDAEAFVVDEQTKDIYIISKRENRSRIYRIAYPQSTTENNVAVYVMDLDYNNVVSAAVAPNGEEVIFKTYTHLYHYRKQVSEPVYKAIQTQNAVTLGYQLEPQGEAVSFDAGGGGFFTLSEEARGVEPKLYYYKKK